MGFLSKLFHRKEPTNILSPIPPWSNIVNIMYDKNLESFVDEVVQVIYNPDRTKRFVILKSEQGYYKYAYEEIHAFDEEEWMYISKQPDALPAMWIQPGNDKGTSFYSSEEDAMKEIEASHEYKTYFLKKE